jgi:hypothetical protein
MVVLGSLSEVAVEFVLRCVVWSGHGLVMRFQVEEK